MDRLAEVLGPRIDRLARRLEANGHHTTIDDRTNQSGVRFRFVPRQGPFDEPGPVGGSVFEIAIDPGSEGVIVARYWLDPLSETPSQEVRAPSSRLTEGWLDGLLVDFVAKTLGRA